jgi:hypothetical protein
MGNLLILMSIFQGLTLLVHASSICTNNPLIQFLDVTNPDLAAAFPDTCELYTGYYLNIAAVVCWFVAGVCAVVLPAPVVVPEHPPQQQTVTYTQNADGTVQETNVAVVKGTPVPPPGAEESTDA